MRKVVKNSRRRTSGRSVPRSNKGLITTFVILAALIVTILALQQQQNLIQEAAHKKDCLTNTKSGSGKNGQENTSNTDGKVNIGKINNDGTSETKVTVNGKVYTGTINSSTPNKVTVNGQEYEYQPGQDINTGGKVGGNNRTDIKIDQNGVDQIVDRSGTDGNVNNNTTEKKALHLKAKEDCKALRKNTKQTKNPAPTATDTKAGKDGTNDSDQRKNGKNVVNQSNNAGGNNLSGTSAVNGLLKQIMCRLFSNCD
jgi:hypothetical protein